MTPQEQQLLESLASRIASTPISQKDPEADALIRQKIGAVPDALYILTQTVLIQEMALNQANNRLHDLQQQIDTHRGEQNPQPTSFLGRLFGTGAPTRPPVQAPPYMSPPPAYAPQYDPPQYPQAPSQTSSFLRSAATTATGVAAGALAFEGIEALFGHHGGYGGGFGGNSFGDGEFLGGGRPEETVINNYYEEPRGDSGSDRFADTSNADFLQNDDSSSSGSDTFDDGSDTSDTSGDDFSSTDV
jgi:hypothetical protein